MALSLSRGEFLGPDHREIPALETVEMRIHLGFQISVFKRMQELGIQQKDLAERMGITPATLSKTLSPDSNITFRTAARIAVALGYVLEPMMLKVFDADEYYGPSAIEEKKNLGAAGSRK